MLNMQTKVELWMLVDLLDMVLHLAMLFGQVVDIEL